MQTAQRVTDPFIPTDRSHRISIYRQITQPGHLQRNTRCGVQKIGKRSYRLNVNMHEPGWYRRSTGTHKPPDQRSTGFRLTSLPVHTTDNCTNKPTKLSIPILKFYFLSHHSHSLALVSSDTCEISCYCVANIF